MATPPKNVPATLLTGDPETDRRISENLAAKGATAAPADTLMDSARKGAEFIASQFAPDANTVGAAGVAKLRSLLPGGAPYEEEFARYNAEAADPSPAEFAMRFVMPAHTVYHGTPARWTPEPGAPLGQFRRSFKHTGEGGAYKGAGAYAAEAAQTAESYRRGLSPMEYEFGGQQIPTAHEYNARNAIADNPHAIVASWVDDKITRDLGITNPTREQIDAELRNIIQWTAEDAADLASSDPFRAKQAARNKAAQEMLGKLNGRKGGSFYALDFPDEQLPNVLDFDAALGDQPAVIEKLQRAGLLSKMQDGRLVFTPEGPQGVGRVIGEAGETSGENLYHALVDAFGGQGSKAAAEKASQALAAAGIPAHRFLDAGSRGAGEGSRNFVVYEPDKWLKTVERFDSLDAARQAAAAPSKARLLKMAEEARAAGRDPGWYEAQARGLDYRDDLLPKMIDARVKAMREGGQYAHGGMVGGECMAPKKMAAGGAVSPVTLAIEEEQRRRAMAEQIAAQAAQSRAGEMGPPPMLTGDPSVDAFIGGGVPDGAGLPPGGPGLTGSPDLDATLAAQSAAAPPLPSAPAAGTAVDTSAWLAPVTMPPGLRGRWGDPSASLASNPELGADAFPQPSAPAPAPAPAQPLPAPPQAAPAPAPAPAAPPSPLGGLPAPGGDGGFGASLGRAEGDLRAAAAQKTAGVNEQAAAEAQRAQAEAAALEEHNRQVAEHQRLTQEAFGNLQKEHEAIVKDMAAGHIDPRRLWASRSGGQKATALVGIILGGIGSGLTGQPNAGLAVVNKAIDDDIEAQRANLAEKRENSRTLLAANFQKTQNMLQAEQLTRLQMAAALEGQLKLAAARSGSAESAARAKQAAADIRASIVQPMLQIAQARATVPLQIEAQKLQIAHTRQSMETAQLQRLALAKFMQGDASGAMFLPADLQERIVRTPDGQSHILPSKEEASKVREQITAMLDVKAKVADMRNQRAKNGAAWLPFGAENAVSKQQQQMLIGALRVAVLGPGTVNDSERAIMENIIPRSGEITSEESFTKRLNQIEQLAQDGVASALAGRAGEPFRRYMVR